MILHLDFIMSENRVLGEIVGLLANKKSLYLNEMVNAVYYINGGEVEWMSTFSSRNDY